MSPPVVSAGYQYIAAVKITRLAGGVNRMFCRGCKYISSENVDQHTIRLDQSVTADQLLIQSGVMIGATGSPAVVSARPISGSDTDFYVETGNVLEGDSFSVVFSRLNNESEGIAGRQSPIIMQILGAANLVDPDFQPPVAYASGAGVTDVVYNSFGHFWLIDVDRSSPDDYLLGFGVQLSGVPAFVEVTKFDLFTYRVRLRDFEGNVVDGALSVVLAELANASPQE